MSREFGIDGSTRYAPGTTPGRVSAESVALQKIAHELDVEATELEADAIHVLISATTRARIATLRDIARTCRAKAKACRWTEP